MQTFALPPCAGPWQDVRVTNRAVQFALVLGAALGVRADEAAERHFVERVKPLLESRCVSCHGPDKVQGGLRLDSREAALKGGDTAPAVVPGEPSKSLLLAAVMHARKDLGMPPKERLTTNDIAVFERWIRDGAPWPKSELLANAGTNAAPAEHVGNAWNDPRNPITRLFGGQRLELWSLKPVPGVTPPAVRNRRWTRNPVDPFILAQIEAAGLAPAPEASKRALGRRLYFDLAGLPPTPAEMERFLADRRPDAFERLVDELLASARYGEQWGRAWLDVVRYSDSNGFDWDEFRPRAWRFRDYVIRAFNADKPFDQFIREQLAGDELFDGPPRTPSEQDALIATSYLRLGPQDNSAASFNEQDRARAELMADLVETTGSAFLGLTMSCCRCHDHKYDPLSQADHYRLRAFFEPLKYADDTPLDLASEQDSIRHHNKSLEAQLAPLQQERDALLVAVKTRLRDERLAKLAPKEKALLDLPKEQRTNDIKVKIEGIEKKVTPSDKELKAAFNENEKQRHEKLEKEVASLKKLKREFTLGLLACDNAGKVPLTKILFQGDHKHEKEPVAPGFLSALDPNPARLHAALNTKSTGRRLTLAEWIASPANPLTARVLVNRVWQGHFGRGLVATPNDFGLAGARPTHPELLDWLAGEFVREGWSLKKLHRLIVTSATYRQRSEIDDLRFAIYEPRGSGDGVENRRPQFANRDPENRLYARQSLRRLSAEQLRDALLAVSGLLTNKPGGPPVWPELPAEVLQANPAFLDDNAEKTKGWYPSPKPEQHARSIYLIQKKTVRVPFLETFDLPENSISCARRAESTVAPQALSLLNSPLAIEASRAFAARVQREAGRAPEAQVQRAFALALQRPPDRQELRACVQLLQQRSLVELCRAVLNLNEFIYLD